MALVADVAQALARRGYDPVITDAAAVRLVRLGALMLDGFGIGAEQNGDRNGQQSELSPSSGRE